MPRHQIKAALVDLSGTIHVGDKVIPGAIQACIRLRHKGLRVKFLTNTTKISSSALMSQLRRIGFDEDAIPTGDIYTSTCLARKMLIKNEMRPLCLVDDDLMSDLEGVKFDDPNCVLVGLAPNAFNYERLNAAFRLLLKVKDDTYHSPLVALHRSNYFRDSDEELSLGPGMFVHGLEKATGVHATVIGKPSKSFFRVALDDMGVDPVNAVMIGDDVVQDIGGAFAAGLGTAVLVKTGKYLPGDEMKIDKKPTFVANSIDDAVNRIIDYIDGF